MDDSKRKIDWRQFSGRAYERLAGRLTWLLSLSIARTALIIVAVFIFDALTPSGICGAVLYMAAVLSAVPIRHRWAIFITGGICCALVLVGWAISPGRGDTELWKVLLNRILVFGVIGAAMGMSESWRRLQARRTKQTQESRLLQQATALAAFEGSFHAALQNSVKVLCEIFGWPVAHVYLKDGDGSHLVSAEIWNLPEDGRFELLKTASSGVRFAPGDGAAGRIWQTGQPIAVADVAQSPHYDWLKEPQRLGVQGAFAFPLIVDGEVAAVLEFFSEHEIRVDPEFSSLAGNVGQQLGRLFERRRANQALRKSEERLRLALHGGRMGTWEWQVDTGRMLWSPEQEQIRGMERGTFAGTFEAFVETIHPEDRQRVVDEIHAAVADKKEFHSEYRVLRPGGEVMWIEGRGDVHPGPDGTVQRMIGLCVDITQRKLVEVELRRAKETAESANRLRGQFLANVSHELRTPMSAILGMLQLSLEEDALTDDLRENLETAKRSADSLLVLLNDVLDFSRIEANGLRVQSAPFTLRDIVDDTIRPLAARAFESGLELVCDVAADVPDALEGDADRLRQVLTNLVANAIKFTEQGEVVVVVALEKRLPRETRLSFLVRDTGIGIAPADQQRIFEPFMQADATSTRRFGGVGLGLAICTELVRLMGGRLTVDSTPGEGSRFSFSLTFHVGQDNDDARGALPYERLESLPVLVVDDNETNRSLLVETLQRWSMQPEPAIDADHALGKLHRAQSEGRGYSLIVVDALMPGMSGLELSQRINNDFADAPPVVLMVAGADRHSWELGEQSTFVAAHLEKPVSPSLLLDALMTTLDVQPPEQPAGEKPLHASPAGCRLSVLVVEDTLANQKVIGSILRRRGHNVTVADHGGEAMDRLTAGERFDVILMDVQMPVMDGYETTAAVRRWEDGDHRRTPIVAMTAHAMEGDREKCLAAGMDTYLAKPIDVQRLIEVVEGITNGAQRSDVAGVLDVENTLTRLGGDRELLAEFIGVFREDAPGLVETIEMAIAGDDLETLGRAAHSLKGLAANIGAVALSQTAGELERMAAASQLGGAGPIVSRLKQELHQLDDALAEQQRSAKIGVGKAD